MPRRGACRLIGSVVITSAMVVMGGRSKASPEFVRMKRRIQEKIYDQTKDLRREELVAYFHRHAETGPFADLWKKPRKRTRSTTRQTKP